MLTPSSLSAVQRWGHQACHRGGPRGLPWLSVLPDVTRLVHLPLTFHGLAHNRCSLNLGEETGVLSTHSFHKYFMSTYYVPDTGPSAGDTAVGKTKPLSLWRLPADRRGGGQRVGRPWLECVSLEFKDIGQGWRYRIRRLGLDRAENRVPGLLDAELRWSHRWGTHIDSQGRFERWSDRELPWQFSG